MEVPITYVGVAADLQTVMARAREHANKLAEYRRVSPGSSSPSPMDAEREHAGSNDAQQRTERDRHEHGDEP